MFPLPVMHKGPMERLAFVLELLETSLKSFNFPSLDDKVETIAVMKFPRNNSTFPNICICTS